MYKKQRKDVKNIELDLQRLESEINVLEDEIKMTDNISKRNIIHQRKKNLQNKVEKTKEDIVNIREMVDYGI